ncbi:MAG TPA: alpha/beta hydrolase [Trebonia sp.]
MLSPGWSQVTLDGVTQAYEVVGSGPVCFAHSGGPGIDSDYLRMPLLENRMTVVYLDPIGTGKSGLLPGGDYSVAEYARRLELLRDHLGVTDGFLLGHSHGGFVAQQHALDYPGRMRGLIVYDSAPTNSLDLGEEARRQAVAFAERWPDRPEVLAAERTFIGSNGTGPRDAVHDADSHVEYLNAIMPLYFADFRRTVRNLGKPPELHISSYDPARRPSVWDVRGKLGAVETPTLVIVGTYDFVCPPVWSRQIGAEIPDSRLAEFTESGHFPHIEEPERFCMSVSGFVARASQG